MADGDTTDRLRSFLSASHAASWPEALWHAVLEYFRGYDLHAVLYLHIPPMGTPDEGRIRVVADGFPEDWLHDYIRAKHYMSDPVPPRALQGHHPAMWSRLITARKLTAAERKVHDTFQAAGFDDGLAIPVFGPGGRQGCFMIPLDNIESGLAVTQMREFQMVTQIGHLTYCKMVSSTLPPYPDLSAREAEILQWVARGKSNGVIAEIIGLSPHTVDAYIRRIFGKLGATDRISAAIRAMGSGLIRSY